MTFCIAISYQQKQIQNNQNSQITTNQIKKKKKHQSKNLKHSPQDQ